MDAPVADAGLGVGVREQPVQPGAAAALALTDPLGGLRLGLAEGGVDPRVERGVGHALLDQPLGLDLERVYVRWRSVRAPRGRSGRRNWRCGCGGSRTTTRGCSGCSRTRGTSVTRMRNALGAVVAVERSDVEVDAVGAANRERGDVGCEWGGRASLQTLYRAPSHRTGFRERCGVEDVGGPWGRRSPTALPHPAAHR